jgi:hypothetical protein
MYRSPKRPYVGEKFQGAWSIEKDGQPILLQTEPFNLMDAGIRVVASRSHRDPRT